jgi:hypothetical protein
MGTKKDFGNPVSHMPSHRGRMGTSKKVMNLTCAEYGTASGYQHNGDSQFDFSLLLAKEEPYR